MTCSLSTCRLAISTGSSVPAAKPKRMSSHRLSCPGHRSINEPGVGTAAEKGHRDVIRMLVFSIRVASADDLKFGGHYRFENRSHDLDRSGPNAPPRGSQLPVTPWFASRRRWRSARSLVFFNSLSIIRAISSEADLVDSMSQRNWWKVQAMIVSMALEAERDGWTTHGA